MHFAKTYSLIISGLPPEFQESAVQYRQLKKLINQTVHELSSLGLHPPLLQELLDYTKQEDYQDSQPDPSKSNVCIPKVIYQVNGDAGRVQSHLRLSIDDSTIPISLPVSSSSEVAEPTDDTTCEALDLVRGRFGALQVQSWLANIERRLLQQNELAASLIAPMGSNQLLEQDDVIPHPGRRLRELIVPLAADAIFVQTLSTTVGNASAHLLTVQKDFMNALEDLSRNISLSARPSSATTVFRPHSRLTAKPWAVHTPSKTKSDLYSWREIFQLYVETQVFESLHESDRGERSVEESERRLKLFGERATQRSHDRSQFKLKSSRDALDAFLQLNVSILNVKRFQVANAEAARKIVKKHNKRTSLAIPFNIVVLSTQTSLPRTLVQAIGETLLPIIPHLDDYSCVICTSIAFKPIRLNCGHLFCVRCLVKMQKRGKANCPICRAPCVLIANKTNVDWALLNFMQDWFPVEAKEKMHQNEKEAAREELEEIGFNPDNPCTIM